MLLALLNTIYSDMSDFTITFTQEGDPDSKLHATGRGIFLSPHGPSATSLVQKLSAIKRRNQEKEDMLKDKKSNEGETTKSKLFDDGKEGPTKIDLLKSALTSKISSLKSNSKLNAASSKAVEEKPKDSSKNKGKEDEKDKNKGVKGKTDKK